MTSTEKLVKALIEAKAPEWFIARAKADVYNDARSDMSFPIVTLIRECEANGLHDVALKAIHGEFDATPEEWDEWIKDGSMTRWWNNPNKS